MTVAYLRSAMDFLNVLPSRRSPFARCVAERTATIKHKHYVRVTGPDGVDMQSPRGVGLGLIEAKRMLEAMPDVSARKVKGSPAVGRSSGGAGAPTKARIT